MACHHNKTIIVIGPYGGHDSTAGTNVFTPRCGSGVKPRGDVAAAPLMLMVLLGANGDSGLMDFES